MEIDDFEETETEVDVLEFALDDDGIEEFIARLIQLKEKKEPFIFELDDENELLISYLENEGDEEDLDEEEFEEDEDDTEC